MNVKYLLLAAACLGSVTIQAKDSIYKKGWIDLNKNGVQDVYEDPEAPIEARVQDLLNQMTLEEKSCQMATLYGFGRVLKDSLPTEGWKNEIWKDGIANIDEQLNGVGSARRRTARCPGSAHPAPDRHHRLDGRCAGKPGLPAAGLRMVLHPQIKAFLSPECSASLRANSSKPPYPRAQRRVRRFCLYAAHSCGGSRRFAQEAAQCV